MFPTKRRSLKNPYARDENTTILNNVYHLNVTANKIIKIGSVDCEDNFNPVILIFKDASFNSPSVKLNEE